MHVLAIDVGSYSIKYFSSYVEKRRINHLDMSEIVLADYLADHPDKSPAEAQVSIVQDIIDTNSRPDTKVVFQADNEMMTTRFLTLPVKSKKKAEQMLPFQLEEDIPYALSEVHYAYRMEPTARTQHYALIGLARENSFETYFNLLREKDALPNILTSEASAVENYFNQNAIAGPFCVLDIGHKTTKAYFFYNSRLIMTHVSYVGGHDVNEMIAQTYKISAEEAIQYKHQNAFLLTQGQMTEVDAAQREFATAMEKVFHTLVADFTRWKIGFKVNYGLAVQHVFITGGTTNIKNIANYLTEKWDTKVVLLETFDDVEGKVDLNAKNKSKFALANMLVVGMRRKNRFINLLNGKFAQAGGAEIPLHSFAFIGIRVAFVMLVLMASLVIERVFIHRSIQRVNVTINKYLKENSGLLKISPRQRRELLVRPASVLTHLNSQQRGVKQEISTLQAAVQIEALSPLVTISQVGAGVKGATLTEFKANDNGEITALFTVENETDLADLRSAIEGSRISEANIQVDQAKLTLTLTGVDK